MAGPRPVLLLNTAVDKGRDGGGPRMLGGHVCPRSLEERRNSEEGEQGEEQRRWGKVIIRHDTTVRARSEFLFTALPKHVPIVSLLVFEIGKSAKTVR